MCATECLVRPRMLGETMSATHGPSTPQTGGIGGPPRCPLGVRIPPRGTLPCSCRSSTLRHPLGTLSPVGIHRLAALRHTAPRNRESVLPVPPGHPPSRGTGSDRNLGARAPSTTQRHPPTEYPLGRSTRARSTLPLLTHRGRVGRAEQCRAIGYTRTAPRGSASLTHCPRPRLPPISDRQTGARLPRFPTPDAHPDRASHGPHTAHSRVITSPRHPGARGNGRAF